MIVHLYVDIFGLIGEKEAYREHLIPNRILGRHDRAFDCCPGVPDKNVGINSTSILLMYVSVRGSNGGNPSPLINSI